LHDQQQIHNAQATLATAQDASAATSATNAVNTQPPSAPAIAQARADVAIAAAAVVQAQRNLDATTLVAPADGTIADIAAHPGEYVAGGPAGTGNGSSGADVSRGLITLDEFPDQPK
jgi:multidrug resistance efflux pump